MICIKMLLYFLKKTVRAFEHLIELAKKYSWPSFIIQLAGHIAWNTTWLWNIRKLPSCCNDTQPHTHKVNLSWMILHHVMPFLFVTCAIMQQEVCDMFCDVCDLMCAWCKWLIIVIVWWPQYMVIKNMGGYHLHVVSGHCYIVLTYELINI